MKENYLILGIAVLIIGGFMILYGYTVTGDYQTFTWQLERFFSASTQKEYMFTILMAFLGIILAVLGLGLTTYGIVAKKEEYLTEHILHNAQSEISLYFQYCPLCYAKGSVTPKFSFFGGKDYISCSKCTAKWHFFYGFGGLKWAKLVNVNVDGKGVEFLNIEYPLEFWQRTALQKIS
jgi:hypothetical protein